MTRPTTNWQRGLHYFNGHLFVPNGTDGTGSGLGAPWTHGVGITIAHATPAAAFDTQLKRTTYTQVVTTTNQELGPRQSLASEYQYWPGNARFCGGFYMSATFRIEAWDDDTGRLFVGMTNSSNAVCISDTVPNNTCGLWHDGTMGQDVLKFVIKNNAGTTASLDITTHAANPGILAAGHTFVWEMWHYPGPTLAVNPGINGRLALYDTSNDSEAIPFNKVKKVAWEEQGNILTTNRFMAPQVQMSNGGTDNTAGHFSLGVANIYCAPWSGEMD